MHIPQSERWSISHQLDVVLTGRVVWQQVTSSRALHELIRHTDNVPPFPVFTFVAACLLIFSPPCVCQFNGCKLQVIWQHLSLIPINLTDTCRPAECLYSEIELVSTFLNVNPSYSRLWQALSRKACWEKQWKIPEYGQSCGCLTSQPCKAWCTVNIFYSGCQSCMGLPLAPTSESYLYGRVSDNSISFTCS